MLALAHTLITEGLHDRAFIDRYCSGYQTLERYLSGRSDGVPKSAAWASNLCGLPEDDIIALARDMAAHRTLVTVTWSLQRIEHGEQPVWAAIALAGLLGQIGLPGAGFGHGYGSMGDVGDEAPASGFPALPAGDNPVDEFIPVARIADMLLHPGGAYSYDGATRRYPHVRLAYWAGGNPYHHHQDLNRLNRAFARLDTLVVHEPYWTATARRADIVLPSTTSAERADIGVGRRDTHIIAMHKAIVPVGAARDDHDILAGLARRLGTHRAFTEGRTPEQWLRNMYGRWRAALLREGHRPPTYEDFWSAGEWEMPPGPPDRTVLSAFRDDPENRPLATPTGRIVLSSPWIAGLGLADCPGHPAWIEPRQWSGAAAAADHPLLLIADQPATRLHSQLDMGRTSRRGKVAGREALHIHPGDARARGVANGDTVLVRSQQGACLAGARLDPDLRPGVVRLPTGAWYTPITTGPETGVCAHGNPNVLTADLPTSGLSQGCTGQHVLVEVERRDDVPPVHPWRPPTIRTDSSGTPPSTVPDEGRTR